VEEAKAALGEALKLADGLAREHPEASDRWESLATILHVFARLQRHCLNDHAGAIASEQRAVAIHEELVQDHPGLTKYQFGLAGALSTLGRTSVEAGGDLAKFNEAEVAIKRSIDILEKLAAEHPDDMRIVEALGYSYVHMSQVLDQRGDGQSAQGWSSRAIQVLRSLARRDTRNLWAGRNRLASFLAERAETWTRLGRFTEALPDFKEAAELAHSIGSRGEELYQAFHALTKARLGDLSELALRRDEICNTVNAGTGVGRSSVYGYVMLYYDAACVHAALAQLAAQDKKSLPAERRRVADRDIRRALELLDTAHATGEFKGWYRLDTVRSERLLDALRAHPKFQLLMMDLEFPDDVFGFRRASP
jgi:tetratricopeptide (TPR) repeat protein